jgi:hypothetical protein
LRLYVGTMSTRSHLDDPQYWRDRAEEIRTIAERMTNEQARQSLFGIVRDYEALAERAVKRLPVAQQQQQLQPEEVWRHKIEPSASGGFIAFWENRAVYANGHMRKFLTEVAARSFLARCDAAGKIIHEA